MNFLDKYICKDLQYIICGFLSPNKTELHWDIKAVESCKTLWFVEKITYYGCTSKIKNICETINGTSFRVMPDPLFEWVNLILLNRRRKLNS